MAKKALLDVLEQTIGKYVKNLDAESLNVAVWSGKIALNNLELDVAAVNAELDRQAAEAPNLALPLQVISGQFQSLEVDVPWASLTGRSVVLRAQGLHISVRPHDRLATTDHLQTVVGSEEARAAKIQQARENSIQLSDKYRQQAYAVQKLASDSDELDDNAKPSEHSSSFRSRLVRRIIENIQIEIKDVHIAVDDVEGTAGVVLESLSLVTTDKDGKQVFVDRTKDRDDNSFLHKMLLMQGFGIYLDHENRNTEKFVTAKMSLGAIQEVATNEISDGSNTEPPLPAPAPISPHSYVLAPLSFRAKLRQADGHACVDYAKYQLSSELSSLSILLSRNQLELARHISKQVSSSKGAASCPLFPEYRPMTRATSGEAAREWWKYAVRCIGRLNGRRSWVEFFYAFQKKKEYVPLYKRHAHHQNNSWIKPLDPLELDALVKLEQDRTISVEGLMAWRTIADGQVDKEREKRQTKLKGEKMEERSYFSSIFGTSKTTSAVVHSEIEEGEPPIHLSAEELKELETMSKEQFDDTELSKDSKLYDVKFVLNALKINLTSYDMRHLAALEMGTVSVDFAAVANGAFDFNFDLLNLEIQDRVTPNSLFPSVLKSLPPSQRDAAFHLHLSKSKSADQRLEVRLAAFEAVASQMLFRELQHFISASSSAPQLSGKKKNPILAQSLSGSVDLFYDADQGASLQLQATVPEDEEVMFLASPRGSNIVSRTSRTASTSTDLSNVLVDAWKEKTATKATWIIDVDIRAPVVFIPEKCQDPQASILVVDLGHLKFTYGKIDPSTRVVAWFKNYPRENDSELTLDSGTLAINDLTFKVGRAKDWRLLTSGGDDGNSESSIIDPISLSLDFGVEATTQSEKTPRFCCIGVIPTISVRMSPIQGSSIFSVIGSWTGLLATIDEETPDHNMDISQIEDELSWMPAEDFERSVSEDTTSDDGNNDQTQFYFLIALQRLSVTVSLDAESRLEAHLVSVFASTQLMTDGSAVVGLRMGWFWILDMLESSHLRRQRLLAHSNLPRSPHSFAENNQYNVLEELKNQGVFESEYSGSNELANVSYHIVGPRDIKAGEKQGDAYVKSTLDADFSSLFIHWNPHAVKGVSALLERFSGLADEYDDTSSLIVSPPKTLTVHSTASLIQKESLGQTQIRARMQRLDLNLNSARDDLPLFVLTVSQTEVNMLSSKRALEASLSLGDVQIRTPDHMGKTLPSYRILLGLAPGRNDSLLTVKYSQGRIPIEKLQLLKEKVGQLEALAEVDLSPMRLCFVQSQVMALVEYSSEGILGALTAKAASSAARKAIEIADSVAGEKLFRIRATSFDVVLPQRAYSENTIRIHAGFLDVEYSMLPGTGGSKATVELSDVAMYGTTGEDMHEEPIRMSLKVLLPSDEVGTIDEQAMRVDISMSKASFLVSRSQYLQILRTLEGNVGELELFLRDDDFVTSERSISTQKTAAYEATGSNSLTHAGNQFIEKQRRLYLNVTVEVLALQLRDSSLNPIIGIAAVNAAITYRSHPDTASTSSDVSLQNLVCEDLRQKASQSQYRFLVRQGHSDSKGEDFFYIGYSSGNNETSLDLKVGSPQVVLIPDAISEVSAFIEKERSSAKNEEETDQNETSSLDLQHQDERHATASAGFSDESGTIVTPIGRTNLSRVSATTKTCRIVLIDLGSQSSTEPGYNSQLTETLVLQGVFSASMTSLSDAKSGKMIESDFNGQADSMEIFSAFGKEMQSPLQILEPSEGSAHGSTKIAPSGGTEIEIRAAALTPFDFTISMRDAALLSAIVNSLKASFMSEGEADGDEGIDLEGLTAVEAEHIESLALALETTSDRASVGYHTSSSTIVDASDVTTTEKATRKPDGTKIQVKLTMPETKVTVINDLQGLDEALFRASVTNFVAGCEVDGYGHPDQLFDFHMNTSILADYFDTSCNIWNTLLIQPWEITLKGLRAPSRRFHSERLSTTIDLESFPCCISFSEQFLVSLASASRMWSIYSVATAVHLDTDKSSKSGGLKASMAANAARNLITSLPYAIENNTGIDLSVSLPGTQKAKFPCRNGATQYFRFEPPNGGGYGGKRAYGQDLEFEKSVTIHLADDNTISIGHLDHEFGSKRAHKLKDGGLILTHVVKEGKTTVLHLISHVSVVNNTSLPFNISFEDGVQEQPIGTCVSHNLKRGNDTPLTTSENGIASKESKGFSVPVHMLKAYHRGWAEENTAKLNLSIYPLLPGADSPKMHGIIAIAASLDDLRKSGDGRVISKFDVVCSPRGRDQGRFSTLVVQVVLKATLTHENEAQIEVCLEPRALIENKFPVRVNLRTPMPHTFSSSPHEEILGQDVVYTLDTGHRVEVFTPGPSIAITLKTADSPIAGCDLSWLDGGWIDLPLVPEFSLLEPVRCLLPFHNHTPETLSMAAAVGNEFFVTEGAQSLADLAAPEGGKSSKTEQKIKATIPVPEAPLRTFFVTVCYYGVDHTGDVLFAQVLRSDPLMKMVMNDSTSGSRRASWKDSRRHPTPAQLTPFGAFGSANHQRRITLLPSGNVPLQILQLTMEGDAGFRRSLPFFVEELPIGEGGVDTIPLLWENQQPSGYYAYRSISNEHQSEVHVVPEFLVFNGSHQLVLVKERGQPEIIVEGDKVSRLGVATRQTGLEIALYFIELDCRTSFIRVDKLGMKMAVVQSNDGVALGSVCVQTVIDTHGDARLVVKIGEIDKGHLGDHSAGREPKMFGEDFFRFRVRWTELQLILNELQKPDYTSWRMSQALSKWNMTPTSRDSANRSSHELPAKIDASPGEVQPETSRFNFFPTRNSNGEAERRSKISEILQQPIASIIFSRFTVDFQRVFKDQDSKSSKVTETSPERSQISLIVHNVIVKDLTPDSPFPMVFDSSSPDCSFLDLCIRIRGPLDAEMVKVDLFDLNLAHNTATGVSERIKLTTSEEYVWRIIDLANRIMAASGDFAGYVLKLVEDEEHGGFIVKMESQKSGPKNQVDYTPPKSDTLYDINIARVSPFCLLLSFKRNPQMARYKKVGSNVGGSAMMNYFSRRLKFTIDRAELKFARFENRSLKGPPDRLFENLFAVYTSRMKFKLVTLLTSASLQDWKFLAARGNGDDEYVEGDILRATGNLTGKASHLILKRVGQTLGDGVSDITRVFGDHIESTSDRIGVGRVGAGVNSVVSGVGDGFGSTLSGVGSGTGKILKGAGQGIGHAIGGVAGGAMQIGKGIGKGIAKGDGKAVLDGFSQGVSSAGGGLAVGAETAVVGAADGLFSAGRGLFSGVKSVGRGIGGAFTGKKPERKEKR